MKKVLAIGLLFLNFNCFGSLFENEPTGFVDLARFPVLVHLCNKADALEKPDIKIYIGKAIFGEDWETHLRTAQIAVARDIFRQVPPPAYNLVEIRICQKAQQEQRTDVLDFLHTNGVTREIKFQSWPRGFQD